MSDKAKNTENKKFDEVNTKEMLKDLGSKNVKIKLKDRMEVEIISDNTRFYKKGQRIKPHIVFAKKLIADKVAKEVK